MTTSISSRPRTAVVAGASGLIGRALVASLRSDGWRVVRLTRRAAGADDAAWDPERGTIDASRLVGAEAVVNLAGEPIGERWSDERKRRIRDSRVRGTTLLARAIAELPAPPRVLVNGSAIGYYGDRGDELLDERSTGGDDFLARVCAEWEGATAPASDVGIRVVRARSGVVLARQGGALARMLLPFRLGLGGKLGSGEQWMSWISLVDEVRALRFAIDDEELSGPVNLCAPNPVKNSELTGALGRVLERPTLLAVPTFALEAMFGEMARATLLASQRAVPGRLGERGFTFEHATVEAALRAALA